MEELLVPERLRAGVRADVNRVAAGGVAPLIANRVALSALHRNGRELPVELGLSVVGTEDGTQLVAVMQDISERKETEARTRREVPSVKSVEEAILTMALDRTIESCNPAAEKLYGYTAKEMVGASMEMLQLDELGAVTTDWEAVRHGGSVTLDSSVRRNDGTAVDITVTLSPLRDDSGELTGVVSVAHDIGAARRGVERLAEAESRFAGAFEAASTGMALTSRDGRFLAVNPALCAFLGRDAETLLASSVQAVTHPR